MGSISNKVLYASEKIPGKNTLKIVCISMAAKVKFSQVSPYQSLRQQIFNRKEI